MSADVWESHDRVTGPYCRTCGSDSVGCSDCHEAELATLRTTLAQVTAERDRWVVWRIKGVPGAPDAWTTDISHASGSGPRATLIRSPEQFASVVASIVRADLAAQVEGLLADVPDRHSGTRREDFIRTRNRTLHRVIRILRGPHAD